MANRLWDPVLSLSAYGRTAASLRYTAFRYMAQGSVQLRLPIAEMTIQRLATFLVRGLVKFVPALA